MSIFQALILGLVQGVTEFLPISSSGHLVFAPALFGWPDQGLVFDVVVHLGTLVAVVVYFRKMIWRLFRALFIKENPGSPAKLNVTGDRKLAWFLILSIIPAGIVGLFFGDWIEANLRSPMVIAISLIGWGIVLFVADKYCTHCHLSGKTVDSLQEVRWHQALFISLAQAIALIPGTSRSGITMSAGLFAKLTKEDAARFSFLMSVPVIAVAGVVKINDLVTQGNAAIDWLAYGVGFASAAVSGFFAIAGLMKLIQKWRFTPFVVYRVVVGMLILLFLI